MLSFLKRVFSFLLAAALAVQLFPLSAMAEAVAPAQSTPETAAPEDTGTGQAAAPIVMTIGTDGTIQSTELAQDLPRYSELTDEEKALLTEGELEILKKAEETSQLELSEEQLKSQELLLATTGKTVDEAGVDIELTDEQQQALTEQLEQEIRDLDIYGLANPDSPDTTAYDGAPKNALATQDLTQRVALTTNCQDITAGSDISLVFKVYDADGLETTANQTISFQLAFFDGTARDGLQYTKPQGTGITVTIPKGESSSAALTVKTSASQGAWAGDTSFYVYAYGCEGSGFAASSENFIGLEDHQLNQIVIPTADESADATKISDAKAKILGAEQTVLSPSAKKIGANYGTSTVKDITDLLGTDSLDTLFAPLSQKTGSFGSASTNKLLYRRIATVGAFDGTSGTGTTTLYSMRNSEDYSPEERTMISALYEAGLFNSLDFEVVPLATQDFIASNPSVTLHFGGRTRRTNQEAADSVNPKVSWPAADEGQSVSVRGASTTLYSPSIDDNLPHCAQSLTGSDLRKFVSASTNADNMLNIGYDYTSDGSSFLPLVAFYCTDKEEAPKIVSIDTLTKGDFGTLNYMVGDVVPITVEFSRLVDLGSLQLVLSDGTTLNPSERSGWNRFATFHYQITTANADALPSVNKVCNISGYGLGSSIDHLNSPSSQPLQLDVTCSPECAFADAPKFVEVNGAANTLTIADTDVQVTLALNTATNAGTDYTQWLASPEPGNEPAVYVSPDNGYTFFRMEYQTDSNGLPNPDVLVGTIDFSEVNVFHVTEDGESGTGSLTIWYSPTGTEEEGLIPVRHCSTAFNWSARKIYHINAAWQDNTGHSYATNQEMGVYIADISSLIGSDGLLAPIQLSTTIKTSPDGAVAKEKDLSGATFAVVNQNAAKNDPAIAYIEGDKLYPTGENYGIVVVTASVCGGKQKQHLYLYLGNENSGNENLGSTGAVIGAVAKETVQNEDTTVRWLTTADNASYDCTLYAAAGEQATAALSLSPETAPAQADITEEATPEAATPETATAETALSMQATPETAAVQPRAVQGAPALGEPKWGPYQVDDNSLTIDSSDLSTLSTFDSENGYLPAYYLEIKPHGGSEDSAVYLPIVVKPAAVKLLFDTSNSKDLYRSYADDLELSLTGSMENYNSNRYALTVSVTCKETNVSEELTPVISKDGTSFTVNVKPSEPADGIFRNSYVFKAQVTKMGSGDVVCGDSVAAQVYNANAMVLEYQNTDGEWVAVGTTGSAGDTADLTISNRNRIEKLIDKTDYTQPLSETSLQSILALNREIYLHTPLRLKANPGQAYNQITDMLHWSTDANSGANSDEEGGITLMQRNGVYYVDLDANALTSPRTAVVLNGAADASAATTTITATHQLSGASASVTAATETLAGKLYLFQLHPAIPGKVVYSVYTDAEKTASAQRTSATDENGAFAIYAPYGLAGNVEFTATDADTQTVYKGTFSYTDLKTGEQSNMKETLYPLNTIEMVPATKITLNLKTLVTSGDTTVEQNFAGKVRYSYGVYKVNPDDKDDMEGTFCPAQVTSESNPRQKVETTVNSNGRITVELSGNGFGTEGDTGDGTLKPGDELIYRMELEFCGEDGNYAAYNPVLYETTLYMDESSAVENSNSTIYVSSYTGKSDANGAVLADSYIYYNDNLATLDCVSHSSDTFGLDESRENAVLTSRVLWTGERFTEKDGFTPKQQQDYTDNCGLSLAIADHQESVESTCSTKLYQFSTIPCTELRTRLTHGFAQGTTGQSYIPKLTATYQGEKALQTTMAYALADMGTGSTVQGYDATTHPYMNYGLTYDTGTSGDNTALNVLLGGFSKVGFIIPGNSVQIYIFPTTDIRHYDFIISLNLLSISGINGQEKDPFAASGDSPVTEGTPAAATSTEGGQPVSGAGEANTAVSPDEGLFGKTIKETSYSGLATENKQLKSLSEAWKTTKQMLKNANPFVNPFTSTHADSFKGGLKFDFMINVQLEFTVFAKSANKSGLDTSTAGTNANIDFSLTGSVFSQTTVFVSLIPFTCDFSLGVTLDVNSDLIYYGDEDALTGAGSALLNLNTFVGLGITYPALVFRIGGGLNLVGGVFGCVAATAETQRYGVAGIDMTADFRADVTFLVFSWSKVIMSDHVGINKWSRGSGPEPMTPLMYHQLITKAPNEMVDSLPTAWLPVTGNALEAAIAQKAAENELEQQQKEAERLESALTAQTNNMLTNGATTQSRRYLNGRNADAPDFDKDNLYSAAAPVTTRDGALMVMNSDSNSTDLNDASVIWATREKDGSYACQGKLSDDMNGQNTSCSQAAIGGDEDFAVAAWVQQDSPTNLLADQSVTGEQIAEEMSHSEIMAKVYHKTNDKANGWQSTMKISDSAGLTDLAPTVATNGSQAIVLWQQGARSDTTSSDEIPVVLNEQQRLMYSVYDPATKNWSAAAVLDENHGVTNYRAAMDEDGNTLVAATVTTAGLAADGTSESGSLQHTNSSEIYTFSISADGSVTDTVRQTNNSTEDSSAQVAYLKDKGYFALAWYGANQTRILRTDGGDGNSCVNIVTMDKVGQATGVLNGTLEEMLADNATLADTPIAPNKSFMLVTGKEQTLDELGFAWTQPVTDSTGTGETNDIASASSTSLYQLVAVDLTETDGVVEATSPQQLGLLKEGETMGNLNVWAQSSAADGRVTVNAAAVVSKTSDDEAYATTYEVLLNAPAGETAEITAPGMTSSLQTYTRTLEDKLELADVSIEQESICANTKVPVSFSVKNLGARTVHNIQVTVTPKERAGETKSVPQVFTFPEATLAPGESKQLIVQYQMGDTIDDLTLTAAAALGSAETAYNANDTANLISTEAADLTMRTVELHLARPRTLYAADGERLFSANVYNDGTVPLSEYIEDHPNAVLTFEGGAAQVNGEQVDGLTITLGDANARDGDPSRITLPCTVAADDENGTPQPADWLEEIDNGSYTLYGHSAASPDLTLLQDNEIGDGGIGVRLQVTLTEPDENGEDVTLSGGDSLSKRTYYMNNLTAGSDTGMTMLDVENAELKTENGKTTANLLLRSLSMQQLDEVNSALLVLLDRNGYVTATQTLGGDVTSLDPEASLEVQRTFDGEGSCVEVLIPQITDSLTPTLSLLTAFDMDTDTEFSPDTHAYTYTGSDFSHTTLLAQADNPEDVISIGVNGRLLAQGTGMVAYRVPLPYGTLYYTVTVSHADGSEPVSYSICLQNDIGAESNERLRLRLDGDSVLTEYGWTNSPTATLVLESLQGDDYTSARCTTDAQQITVPLATGEVYNDLLSLDRQGENEAAVRLQSDDNSYRNLGSRIVSIDTGAPVIDTASAALQNGTYRIAVTDDLSGIDSVWFYENDVWHQATCAAQSMDNWASAVPGGENTFTLEGVTSSITAVSATDRAGNSTLWEVPTPAVPTATPVTPTATPATPADTPAESGSTPTTSPVEGPAEGTEPTAAATPVAAAIPAAVRPTSPGIAKYKGGSHSYASSDLSDYIVTLDAEQPLTAQQLQELITINATRRIVFTNADDTLRLIFAVNSLRLDDSWTGSLDLRLLRGEDAADLCVDNDLQGLLRYLRTGTGPLPADRATLEIKLDEAHNGKTYYLFTTRGDNAALTEATVKDSWASCTVTDLGEFILCEKVRGEAPAQKPAETTSTPAPDTAETAEAEDDDTDLALKLIPEAFVYLGMLFLLIRKIWRVAHGRPARKPRKKRHHKGEKDNENNDS